MAFSEAASPEVYMSAEELAEEIEYQKVLLLSLDDSLGDSNQAAAGIRGEIYLLGRRLKALREGKNNPIASTTTYAPFPDEDDPFGLPRVDANPRQKIGAIPSTGSTPNSAASAPASNIMLSPSQLRLPTRKRAHGGHLGIDESETKFRRTSPTPHITRSGTPSSSSGPDYVVGGDGFLDLTADDETVSAEIAKVRQRQKEAEEKANRERDDANFARRLQQELSGTSSSASVSAFPQYPTPAGPSAFNRLFGHPQPSEEQQGHWANNRNFSNLGISSSVTGSSLHSHPQLPSHSYLSHSVKADPGQGYRNVMPGTFQDSDSDSDIEFINPSAFNDNGRHTSFSTSQAQNLPALASSHPNGHGEPSNRISATQSSSPYSYPADAARRPELLRMDRPQKVEAQLAYLANYQKNLVAGLAQPGGSTPPNPAANYGMALPQPSMIPAPYSPYLQQHDTVPGSTLNANSHTFGQPTSAAAMNFPGRDPLGQAIFEAAGYGLGSMVDINGYPLDPRIADLNTALHGRLGEISDYVSDPRRTTQEIQDLLENIRPDVEIPKENREGTPEGLKYGLYEHQKLALTWLRQMEEGTNKGGILADDMGLGKTISALALILSRPSQDRGRKTTLIVGPVALVRQWEREIQTKILRSHSLATFLYHSGKKATWDSLRTYDIVLTTYGTLGAEFKRKVEWEKKCDQNPNLDRSLMKNKFPFLGETSLWYRVILDEAQCIKNKNTKAAQGACYLKSRTRFCLTGTPMMNGVHELYSLIHFLRIKPYNDHSKFTSDFGCLSRSGGARGSIHPQMEKNAMKKLQAVLKAILLRRTKTSKIDGNPILTLPEKTEEIVHAIFNDDEQAYYTALETKTRLQFNKYLKANTIGKNYSNILVLLLRLRQAACHPHLIMDFEEAPAEASAEDMIECTKSLHPDVVRRIINATVPFECPVCYDPVANPRIVIPCGHDTCSECLVRIAGNVQQEAIAEGNEAGDAKCPTCRGRIEMKKVIDYFTFKRVHMKDNDNEAVGEEGTGSEDDDDDSIDDLSDTDSDESDGDGPEEDIRKFVVPDDYESSADETFEDEDKDDHEYTEEKTGRVKGEAEKNSSDGYNPAKKENKFKDEEDDDDDSEFVDIKDIKDIKGLGPVKDMKDIKTFKAGKRKPKITAKNSEKPKHKSKRKGKANAKERGQGKSKASAKENKKPKHISLAMLKKEASRSVEGHRRYMRYLRKNWVSSAKVDKCLDILRETDPDVKTIIFSQFTTLLDLVEVPVRQEKWGFMRYDGSMSADARHHAVVNFTDDPRCKIMLVSLKAGNAGLNLVAASQVIILDPFWNPFVEMQAVDRAHRIGQQKPVKVHRILVEKTVEDRIIDLQNQKRKLVEAALDEKASQGLGRLGRQELIYLFNGGGERETAARVVYPQGGGVDPRHPGSLEDD